MAADGAAAPARMSAERSRGWCLTINNHTREHVHQLRAEPATYKCWQEEVGAAGTPHLQIYLHFKNQKNFGTLKRAYPTAHIQKANGTAEQNRAYCSKKETARPDTFEEHGELPQQGRRSDLEQVAQQIKEAGLQKAVEDNPVAYIRHHRGMIALDQHYKQGRVPDRRSVQVIVLWGDPGSGKTHDGINFDLGNSFRMPMGQSTLWLDGYRGERTLIIEDFDGGIKYGEIKQLLDVAKQQFQVKGGYVYGEWTNVIITSNHRPSSWYADMYNGREQDVWDPTGARQSPLQRRIAEIWHYQGMHQHGNVTKTLEGDPTAQWKTYQEREQERAAAVTAELARLRASAPAPEHPLAPSPEWPSTPTQPLASSQGLSEEDLLELEPEENDPRHGVPGRLAPPVEEDFSDLFFDN